MKHINLVKILTTNGREHYCIVEGKTREQARANVYKKFIKTSVVFSIVLPL